MRTIMGKGGSRRRTCKRKKIYGGSGELSEIKIKKDDNIIISFENVIDRIKSGDKLNLEYTKGKYYLKYIDEIKRPGFYNKLRRMVRSMDKYYKVDIEYTTVSKPNKNKVVLLDTIDELMKFTKMCGKLLYLQTDYPTRDEYFRYLIINTKNKFAGYEYSEKLYNNLVDILKGLNGHKPFNHGNIVNVSNNALSSFEKKLKKVMQSMINADTRKIYDDEKFINLYWFNLDIIKDNKRPLYGHLLNFSEISKIQELNVYTTKQMNRTSTLTISSSSSSSSSSVKKTAKRKRHSIRTKSKSEDSQKSQIVY